MSPPTASYSLSGEFTKAGKFFIILAFLFGKNRSLPETSDFVIQFTFPELMQVLGTASPKPASSITTSQKSRVIETTSESGSDSESRNIQDESRQSSYLPDIRYASEYEPDIFVSSASSCTNLEL